MNSERKERLFQQGLDAFNSRHFFEAHEHWEEIWLKTPNPDKMFLQGLIQVAAAFHHYSRENNPGCRNLLREGLTKLERFPQRSFGLAIEPLRVTVRSWIATLETGQNPGTMQFPEIQICK